MIHTNLILFVYLKYNIKLIWHFIINKNVVYIMIVEYSLYNMNTTIDESSILFKSVYDMSRSVHQ